MVMFFMGIYKSALNGHQLCLLRQSVLVMQGAWWFETNQIIRFSDDVLFSKRFNFPILKAKLP